MEDIKKVLKPKVIETETYRIQFDPSTGFEALEGINGHDDPFALEMPNMLDIGIMGHCKNSCEFCYQGAEQQPNMTLEHYKKIIDEVKDVTNQVALGGRGDPNHHEHFRELITYTVENNIVPNYTTSGIDLSPEHVQISKMCGAVAVSDYQEPHTYDALRRFMDNGIKTNIHTIFSKESAERCIKMVLGEDVWEGSVDLDSLNAVVFLLFKPQGRGKFLKSWLPENEQILEFAQAIDKGNAKFKVGMDSCMVNRLKQVGLKFNKFVEMMLDTCEAGRMSSYITSDMKLIPCSFGNHAVHAVSIEDRSIREVFQRGKHFIDVRSILEKNPASCPFML